MEIVVHLKLQLSEPHFPLGMFQLLLLLLLLCFGRAATSNRSILDYVLMFLPVFQLQILRNRIEMRRY